MANNLGLWVCLASCMITFVDSIDAGETVINRTNPHLVTELPGQPIVGFNHYAGYVDLNEQNGRALFYWFYEAPNLKEKKPLVLWLNGGPGCSSVGYGATQEIGPFIINSDGKTLSFNEYSWNREANMLFLESPIGVGFSYSNETSIYKSLNDTIAAYDTYRFLQNWFNIYPQYRTQEFFLAGESYAGKYVPELAELIYDQNKISSKNLYINLKGFVVGNPETYDAYDWQGQMDYAWSHAAVSDETHQLILDYCDFFSNNTFDNQNCTDAVDEVFAQYDKIDKYSLYTPTCIRKNITTNAKHGGDQFRYSANKNMRKNVGGYDPCLDDYAVVYYNTYDVQKALHVLNGSQLRNWSICNYDIFNNWIGTRPSVLSSYQKLMDAGLRIWVYSGDTDGRVPVLSTRYSLNALKVAKSRWRAWYYGGQVGGWTQDYGKLTFSTFRGAGHAVPIFKREASLFFFSTFLSGRSLPKQ